MRIQADATTPCIATERLSIIDLQPDEDPSEVSAPPGLSKCAGCSFRTFLDSRADLNGYWGLAALRRLFSRLPQLSSALRRDDAAGVVAVARDVGARSCFELCRVTRAPRLRLARITTVDLVGESVLQARLHRAEDGPGWMLLEPESWHPERLATEMSCAMKRGYGGVLVGHYAHAPMSARWSSFVDSGGVDGVWRGLQRRAGALGVRSLGLVHPYPPCVALQLGRNRALESLRARLDLHFRMLADTRSLMCPENVSGYGLFNDVRDATSALDPGSHRLAVRYEHVLMCL